MVDITGIAWNSENRDEEIVRLIPLERLQPDDIHQTQVDQPEFGESGQGR